jgi:hypothetical protein
VENPAGWTLLVASLAVVPLDKTDDAWEFLRRQQLVRDEPGNREAFASIVRREIDLGPVPGPSVARRVAMALEREGIALPAGSVPDPGGTIARARLKTLS